MTAHWVYLVYATFALGGVAVYLLMPRVGRSMQAAGVLFGLAALAGAVVLCADQVLAPRGFNVVFFASAAVAVVSAVKVITHRKPVYSALYFVLVVLAVTPLVILQAAEFLAVAMVIIYAGAILVTYVFVIMLAQQGGQPVYDHRAREPFVAVFAGFVTMAVVAAYAARLPQGTWLDESELITSADALAPVDNTVRVGRLMLTDYVVSLELAGVLLLVAMIGAIIVSKKRVPKDDMMPAPPPPGQAGREAPPY